MRKSWAANEDRAAAADVFWHDSPAMAVEFLFWTLFGRFSFLVKMYLSAYARQPARGPTMWAHFVAMLAYVGVCWPILRAMWAHLVAMLAYVGLMLTHVEPKDLKNGNSQKNTVKRRIFWWSAAYLEAMLAYLEGNVGPSWGYVGPSWGYVGPAWGYGGPSWSYVGPSWGYVGPSWGYVGPSWGLCWPILRPILAHVDPS